MSQKRNFFKIAAPYTLVAGDDLEGQRGRPEEGQSATPEAGEGEGVALELLDDHGDSTLTTASRSARRKRASRASRPRERVVPSSNPQYTHYGTAGCDLAPWATVVVRRPALALVLDRRTRDQRRSRLTLSLSLSLTRPTAVFFTNL